jgi:hypothetical protein
MKVSHLMSIVLALATLVAASEDDPVYCGHIEEYPTLLCCDSKEVKDAKIYGNGCESIDKLENKNQMECAHVKLCCKAVEREIGRDCEPALEREL